MAVSKPDDMLDDAQPESRQAVDIVRMLVWAAAAVLPWAAIIIVVRWAMTALG
jgi:hypothetical protein